VEALAGSVDDIELVLFESRDYSNLPDPRTVARLAALAEQYPLTYTVHFPIDRHLGSTCAGERQALLAGIGRAARLTEALQPHSYLLHIDGIETGADAARVRQWQQDVLALAAEVARQVPDPRRIAIENLDYPFEWCDPFLDAFPFSVCIDAGHLWQNAFDWRAHLDRYLARTRVIHLYGAVPGSSAHSSLDIMSVPLIMDFLKSIKGFGGVLTLETFGFEETRTSIERLAQCLEN
jgi:sugar phosphate isomerase/epimerase